MRGARSIQVTLTQQELAHLKTSPGNGGQQRFLREIIIDPASRVVTLTDEQLGRLIRYATQYGPGGFQARLRKAFFRSLRELVSA